MSTEHGYSTTTEEQLLACDLLGISVAQNQQPRCKSCVMAAIIDNIQWEKIQEEKRESMVELEALTMKSYNKVSGS